MRESQAMHAPFNGKFFSDELPFLSLSIFFIEQICDLRFIPNFGTPAEVIEFENLQKALFRQRKTKRSRRTSLFTTTRERAETFLTVVKGIQQRQTIFSCDLVQGEDHAPPINVEFKIENNIGRLSRIRKDNHILKYNPFTLNPVYSFAIENMPDLSHAEDLSVHAIYICSTLVEQLLQNQLIKKHLAKYLEMY
jgi:hypothetical protein